MNSVNFQTLISFCLIVSSFSNLCDYRSHYFWCNNKKAGTVVGTLPGVTVSYRLMSNLDYFTIDSDNQLTLLRNINKKYIETIIECTDLQQFHKRKVKVFTIFGDKEGEFRLPVKVTESTVKSEETTTTTKATDVFSIEKSIEKETTTLEQGPGFPPRNIAYMIDQTTITFSWEPPTITNGQIQSYELYYTDDPSLPLDQWKVETVDGDLMETVISDLSEGTRYNFQIVALNENGKGIPSPTLEIVTGFNEQKPEIDIVEGKEVRVEPDSTLTVTCNVIGGYPTPTVAWYVDGEAVETPFNAETVIMVKEHIRQSSKVECKAENSAGTVEKIVDIIVTGPGSPPLETSYKVDGLDIDISWTEPEITNGLITEYEIFYTTDESLPLSEWSKLIINGDEDSAVVEDLLPRTIYHLKIRALNELGAGLFTRTAHLETLQEVVSDQMQKIEDYKSQLNETEKVLQNYVEVLKNKDSEISALNKIVSDQSQQIDGYKSKLNEIEKVRHNYVEVLKNKDSELSALNKSVDQQEIESKEKNNEIHLLKIEQKRITEDLQFKTALETELKKNITSLQVQYENAEKELQVCRLKMADFKQKQEPHDMSHGDLAKTRSPRLSTHRSFSQLKINSTSDRYGSIHQSSTTTNARMIPRSLATHTTDLVYHLNQTTLLGESAPGVNDVNVQRILVIPRGPKGFSFILQAAKKMEPGVQCEPSSTVPGLHVFEGVDMNGIAIKAGLQPGDFLLEINRVDVRCASYDQVVALIKSTAETISIKVITVDVDKMLLHREELKEKQVGEFKLLRQSVEKQNSFCNKLLEENERLTQELMINARSGSVINRNINNVLIFCVLLFIM